MRLDKFLKISRIIKRRTIAKNVSDLGLIKINGKVSKPSSEVKIGDELFLSLGERQLTIKIKYINNVTNKKQATEMFEIIKDEVINMPLDS